MAQGKCSECSKNLNKNEKKLLGSLCNSCRKVGDSNDTVLLVQNELLTFAVYSQQNANVECAKTAIVDNFSPKDIEEAKELLWKHYDGDLPKFENRNNSERREKHEKEVDDILSSLSKLDNDGKYGRIVFACVDIGRLPKVEACNLDIVSVVQRINALENANKQMSQLVMQHDRKLLGLQDLQSSVELQNDLRCQQASYSKAVKTSNELNNAHAKSLTPSVISKPTHGDAAVGTQRRNSSHSKPRVDGQNDDSTHKPVPVNPCEKVKSGTSHVSADGGRKPDAAWQSQRRQKPDQTQRAQQRNDEMIRAGIRPANVNVFGAKKNNQAYHMFVGGLHKNSSCDGVSKWLKKCKVNSITEVVMLTDDEKDYSSFHIVMNRSDYINIMKNKSRFWPDSVTCRRYFPPKSKSADVSVPGSSTEGSTETASGVARGQAGQVVLESVTETIELDLSAASDEGGDQDGDEEDQHGD